VLFLSAAAFSLALQMALQRWPAREKGDSKDHFNHTLLIGKHGYFKMLCEKEVQETFSMPHGRSCCS
jgi:hypothetical protein